MSEAKPGKSADFDNDKANSYVERIENVNAEIQKEHMAYMSRVGELKQDVADILEEAKSNGFKKKAIKAVVKTRDMQRKLEAIREDLEPEEQDSYDAIRHAIGDLAELPLGKAALDRAERGAKAVDDLTDGFTTFN